MADGDKNPIGIDDTEVTGVAPGNQNIGNRRIRVVDPETGRTQVISGISQKVKLPAYTYENAKRWGTNPGINIAYWQNRLFEAGYYSKGEIPALGLSWSSADVDAMTRAMEDANLGAITLDEVLNTRTAAVYANVRPIFYGSSDYASGSGGSGGGGSSVTTTKYITLTSKQQARQDLRREMLAAIGRLPTAAEYEEYYTKLNENEKKVYRTQTSTSTSVISAGTEFDRAGFLTNFILNRADFTEDASGTVGELQDMVGQLITDYGLNSFVDSSTKSKYLKQLAKGSLSKADFENKLKDDAAEIYTGFADKLKANPELSLRQIANPYISTYASMFELDPNTVDLKEVLSKTSTTLTDGKSSMMSIFDFEKSLRKDARYQYTSRAKQEAAAFGASFARSMGVNI